MKNALVVATPPLECEIIDALEDTLDIIDLDEADFEIVDFPADFILLAA